MKKFEITEEQIKQLDELLVTNHLIRWFPEVFETKLEVGKWYKSGFPLLINVQEIHHHKLVAYGFNSCFEYLDAQDFCTMADERNSIKYDEFNFRLATDSEVLEALTNEAIKRGFKKGVHINRDYFAHNTGNVKITSNTDFVLFGQNNNCLQLGGNCIFEKGKWAEIVKTYTKEEAEKLLNAKIV